MSPVGADSVPLTRLRARRSFTKQPQNKVGGPEQNKRPSQACACYSYCMWLWYVPRCTASPQRSQHFSERGLPLFKTQFHLDTPHAATSCFSRLSQVNSQIRNAWRTARAFPAKLHKTPHMVRTRHQNKMQGNAYTFDFQALSCNVRGFAAPPAPPRAHDVRFHNAIGSDALLPLVDPCRNRTRFYLRQSWHAYPPTSYRAKCTAAL